MTQVFVWILYLTCSPAIAKLPPLPAKSPWEAVQIWIRKHEPRSKLDLRLETVSLTPDFEENAAFVTVPETCGDGGCQTYIFDRNEDVPVLYTYRGTFFGHARVADKITRHRREIEVTSSEGKPKVRRLRYNGSLYE